MKKPLNWSVPARMLSEHLCEVDCSKTPVLPKELGLKEATQSTKRGLAMIERSGTDLFIDGNKFDWFFLRQEHRGDTLLDGYGPHTGIISDFLLHANIGLALFQFKLIPRKYLKDEGSNLWRELWFRGVTFRDSSGQIFWFTLKAEGLYWLPGIRPAWVEVGSEKWEPIAA